MFRIVWLKSVIGLFKMAKQTHMFWCLVSLLLSDSDHKLKLT